MESLTKGHKMMKGLDYLSYDEKMGETCPVTGQEAMGQNRTQDTFFHCPSDQAQEQID